MDQAILAKSLFGFGVAGLTAVLWYYLKLECKPRSLLKLAFFPISHSACLRDICQHPAVVPIAISYIILLSGLTRFYSLSSPHLFLICWGILMIAEAYCVSAYLFRIRSGAAYAICLLIILSVATAGIFLSIHGKSYDPVNLIDFLEDIYLFIGSTLIVARIAKRGRFQEELDAFFVFFGIQIYAILHALSTSVISISPLQFFDFAYLATLITLLYWSAIIPWTRHLKSKLS